MGKKMLTRLLPVFGFLFLTAYVRSAALDVVYTDYIRLVDSYLQNVKSFAPYLHGDILTRIPVNYLERIVNVTLFGYSTMFDMILGCFFLAVSALVAGRYCEKRQVPAVLTGVLILFLFSLNKWEMLTNGSGWVHFAAFALFWYHYLVYDRYLSGNGKRGDGKRLLFLPWIIILFFAGPYCGVYAVTMLIADGFAVLVMKKNKKEALARMLCTALPLGLYLVSRALSVEERAGATTDPITAVIAAKPLLLPEFFVRSFSSMVLGGETMEYCGVPEAGTVLLGLLVLGCYAWAFWLNFRGKLYEKSTFPLLLLTSGFLNHVLVTASRWIFLSSSYGMSSRYALQYQVGIAGIFLTFAAAAAADGVKWKRGSSRRMIAAAAVAVIFAGSLLTTAREIHMAPYRQEHFAAMAEAALNFENLSDDELVEVLQYHDPERIREALTLLKERGLNVYDE